MPMLPEMRLEHKIILSVDEENFEIVAPAQRLLEVLCRVDTREPATQDNHSLAPFWHCNAPCGLSFDEGLNKKNKGPRDHRLALRL